jgi:hypothetical protein
MNITVTTVRNGKIVASRDYHNHAVLAAEMRRLELFAMAPTAKEHERT